MTSTLTQAPEFQDLLRQWRKTRKLSQWALADAADISQRHLSFLESGRSNPSREMVLKLSRALELPLREQNSLLHAAGFAPVFSHDSIDAQSLTHAREALEVILKHHEPYPVVVVDRNWNLLMSNDATLRLFAAFGDVAAIWNDVGGDRPNMLRATLHPMGFRRYIRNWETFVDYFKRQLDEELATNPFNREARELLDEINAYPDMPEAAAIPERSAPFLLLELANDEVELRLFTMISTFGTPLDVTLQELRIETFFPADEATAAFFRNPFTNQAGT